MKFLALDTSTEACSVALALDGQILALDEVCPQQHSKRILPMIQQLLADAGVSLNQLDGIIFGRGPGSFTGVRIGVSVAQGLAFGADLPVFGVSTLAAMAQAAAVQQNATEVIAAIDARMAEVYIAAFTLGEAGLMQAITPEIAAKPAALPEVLTSLSFTSQV
ncbi:MAG: tRNA (adenosine(37)-N6)-threonylcarbamoyltransferase complex dimerization subunit type 1 TsaB, partial [Alishewanella sp. 34-51-39]